MEEVRERDCTEVPASGKAGAMNEKAGEISTARHDIVMDTAIWLPGHVMITGLRR